ncbi:MAG: hypothetical protein QNJ40_15500 [Xanthomonadales bacterium]|nr:hypothetical protein [Xanthomonadales bacterium]
MSSFPEERVPEVPKWFWIVAGVAVVWNLMGVAAYFSDVSMTREAVAALPQAQQELRAATPRWVTGFYAIAVFGGLAAAVVLCLKRRLAIPLFVVSLVAVVVQMGYVFVGINAVDILGPSAMTFPAIIILLGAFQLWFSMHARNRCWIA